MARIIHVKKKPGHGTGYWFRMWCTTMDRYVTEPMSQVEVQKWLKAEAKEIAKREFERNVKEIPARIARAKSRGTSSMIPGDGLTEWREERHVDKEG